MENGARKDRQDERAEDIGNESVTTIFNEGDDIASGKIGDDRDGERNPDNHPEALSESFIKLVFLPFYDILGELWEIGGGDGDTDKADRHLMQRGGLLITAEGAGTHARGEIGIDNTVDIVNSLI